MTGHHHSVSGSSRFRVSNIIGWLIAVALLLSLTAWGVMAIWFASLALPLRIAAAGGYGLVMLLLPLLLRPRRRGIMGSLLLFCLTVAWFLSIPPSNHREWQPDVAILPWATFQGETVSIHQIRNCDYRSETDYSCHYYDRTFHLGKLRSMELFLIHWGSPYIAHPIISFGFGDEGHLCFSVETRKEKGEEYSAVKGFFRQYELTYVVADERDVIRLRTNYRKEEVHLYRLQVKPEFARHVFLDYLAEVNRLHDTPTWYNALTDNCTTSIRTHTIPYTRNRLLDWRIIINGKLDEMLYELGSLDQSLPFAELRRRSYINPVAQAADQDSDFSRRIRSGLPGISP
jgi:Domain of unknown function (DUF4105)